MKMMIGMCTAHYCLTYSIWYFRRVFTTAFGEGEVPGRFIWKFNQQILEIHELEYLYQSSYGTF